MEGKETMKRLSLILVAALLVGCAKSPTAPTMRDPSVLVSNMTPDTVTFQWWDGQGVQGSSVIQPNTTSICERFTARPDSAYFYIVASRNGTVATYTQPWFNPATSPAWTAAVNATGSTDIRVV